MATLIESVSFQNFYNYYGCFNENVYHFKKGINIINADNNMGKTKFFNGILWILRDQVYDTDIKRRVPAESSFLKMASGKAKSEKTSFDMGVKISFFDNDSRDKYSVKKSVHFERSGDGWRKNERLDVLKTTENRDIPVLDISDKKKIISKIFPGELIDYSLLQGEAIENLVDLSSQEGLSSTIEVLSGVKELVEICAKSKEVTRRIRDKLSRKESEISAHNSEITNLIQRRKEYEDRIESIKTQIEQYKLDLSGAVSKKENLEAILLNAEKRQKFREIMKVLSKEIDQLKNQKNIKEKEINSLLFSEDSPWLLMDLDKHISEFDTQRQKYIAEIAGRKAIDNSLKLPEGSPDIPSLKRMLENGKCEVCNRDAPEGSDPWLYIQNVLERPLNKSDANKNDFSSFFGSIQKNIGAFALSIPKIQKTIQEYRKTIDDLEDLIIEKEEEKETAKLEFFNAGGGENVSDVVDRQNISEYAIAESSIEKNEELIKVAEGRITEFQALLDQDENIIEENSTNEEIKEFRRFRDIIESVERMFCFTKERIFDDILKDLEVNANKWYSELTKGNLALGGKLEFTKQTSGTVKVSVKDVNDGLITGLGTGFQRMKQLAIIMAIISSKVGNQQFDYPFISDAPFSEFGKNFINNFFNSATNVFSQSIILIKELYDPNSDNHLNSLGDKILERMKNGEINGTFYVNLIEEAADTTNLVTKSECYKY